MDAFIRQFSIAPDTGTKFFRGSATAHFVDIAHNTIQFGNNVAVGTSLKDLVAGSVKNAADIDLTVSSTMVQVNYRLIRAIDLYRAYLPSRGQHSFYVRPEGDSLKIWCERNVVNTDVLMTVIERIRDLRAITYDGNRPELVDERELRQSVLNNVVLETLDETDTIGAFVFESSSFQVAAMEVDQSFTSRTLSQSNVNN